MTGSIAAKPHSPSSPIMAATLQSCAMAKVTTVCIDLAKSRSHGLAPTRALFREVMGQFNLILCVKGLYRRREKRRKKNLRKRGAQLDFSRPSPLAPRPPPPSPSLPFVPRFPPLVPRPVRSETVCHDISTIRRICLCLKVKCASNKHIPCTPRDIGKGRVGSLKRKGVQT